MPISCIVVLTLAFSVFKAGAIIDASLQMQLGNPSGATADTNNHDHYLIERPIEAIDYNDNHGEPNWASWDLTADDANGAVPRQDSFAADTNLPANFFKVGSTAYSGSGYARGHLCPSGDRTDSTNNNDMTFLMSNMMPQVTANNSGTWNNFESYCRSLVQSTNNYELLIICGPSGFTGDRINTNGYVWIPQYTWKIAVVVPPGAGNAVDRITATNRVICIKVPNTNGVSSVWQDFVTSANQIQVDTGLTFFTSLPADVATALRAKVDGQTNPPPEIYVFTPTSGEQGTSVIVTGTNFTGATAVAINGTEASYTVDSVTQITAVVPTNAGSGLVSVTTASGTAISTNNFTVLNNGGSVYSGVLAGWDMSGLTGGSSNFGASPFPATTNAANVAVVGLTRGSSVKTTGTAAAGAWGGVGFTNVTASSAVGADQFVLFSLAVSNGYQVSYSSISPFDYYRSGTGPTNGVLQYELGTNGFNDITNLSYPTASSGASIAAIDLSGIGDLQNIGATTNVTFRIVNMNGGASGTWYVYNKAGDSAVDLAVQGTVTQIVTTNPPAIAPSFASINFAGNQFSFTLTGTMGSNYVVLATTNLAVPDWAPLMTNPAPFSFMDSNVGSFDQRYYRAVVEP